MTRRSGAYLAVGVALTAAYFALPRGGDAQSVLYDTIGGATVVAILAGIRLNRPATAVPWMLFAAANAVFVVGDVLYDVYPAAPSPSTADCFYLSGYPLLAAGLLVLIVRSGGHHRAAAVGEAAVATFAFALIQWVFVMHPALMGPGTEGARAVAATYAAGDVVLLAGFAGCSASSAWRRPAFLFLIAAVAFLLVGDEANSLAPQAYSQGAWVDSMWLMSYVMFGVTALHPGMREIGEPRRTPALRVSTWRITLLTLAILTPAGVLLTQWVRGGNLEVPAVVAAMVLIVALVVWRLTGILRALERLRVRERAARTEAQESRERLQEQNERLREADRLKDEFVALISHDLRTPLTSIIGYTELAREEVPDAPLDDERRGYLEVVARSAERLLRLVDDLLFVARLQAGKGLDLTVADLDLAAVAEQAVREAQPRAAGRDLELRLSADSRPVPVRADRGRVFQLLDNLVANAIKFTPPGGEIEVHVEHAGDSAVLEVRDTGIGLDPEEAERLFDRFYRTTRAVESQIPGTGLGLYIARAITEAHGGRISAGARRGGGTVFRIELPTTSPHPAGEPELVA